MYVLQTKSENRNVIGYKLKTTQSTLYKLFFKMNIY